MTDAVQGGPTKDPVKPQPSVQKPNEEEVFFPTSNIGAWGSFTGKHPSGKTTH